MSSLLSLRNASKLFTESGGRIELFRDLDFDLEAGEFVAVTGASGVGKSTLLHILGMLERATSGTLRFGGEDVSTLGDARVSRLRNRSIGFVFQSFQLVPQLTVLENVEVPLFYAGVSRADRHRIALERLEQVGLGSRVGHRPPQLSGGEQQRVAIARALSNDPRLLLADEPTGNLDSATGEQVLDLIRALHRSGRTIVMITHDAHVAAAAARRVRILDGRIRDGDA